MTDLITGSSGIQDITVNFDAVGNLDMRSDATTGFVETYAYDTLNCLTDAWSDFGNGAQWNTTPVTISAIKAAWVSINTAAAAAALPPGPMR